MNGEKILEGTLGQATVDASGFGAIAFLSYGRSRAATMSVLASAF
jgi:hypothetical protein